MNNIALEYRKIHSKDNNFGNRTIIPSMVVNAIEKYKPSSILDFGCGKGLMTEQLKKKYPNIQISGWDPAFHKENELPDSIDMIISTDVLEHIEYDKIDEVLQKLKRISNKIQYHLIACHKASKILSDGRNAHLIVEAPDWWKEKIKYNNFVIEIEDIESRISNLKNGDSIAVVKYQCIIR